jgi:cell wall-associated NlpC family hydrolase
MRRAAIAAVVGVTLVGMLTVMAAVGVLADLGGALGGELAPSAQATATIPPEYLALYQRAATTCPGLPWSVLAGIGTIESDHGRSTAPGVRTGANRAGARGPMQFLPATFDQYALPVPPGGADPPSPYDPTDAVHAAARLLCDNGARDGTDLPGAVFAYNHADWYVQDVLALAASYDTSGGAGAAVAYATAQLGTPYRWGGEGPGGFDCSGLVQAAYAVVGIRLPRVAQQQYDTGPRLPAGMPLLPGDLVFFGTSPTHVTHVGMVVSPGLMVDAPYTGAVVRIEPYARPTYLGATRPAARTSSSPRP